MKRNGPLIKKLWGIAPFVFFVAVAGAQTPGQRRGSFHDMMDAVSEMDRAFEAEESYGEGLTTEDEYYLGRAVAAQIVQAYPLYNGDPALVSYLNRICLAIAINSPQPELFDGYHVAILDTQEINAFATPGGHIFITRGLLACAGSEDALAAVIAHELAHIQLHHALAIINDQWLANELSQAANRTASLAARNANVRQQALLRNRLIGEMVTALFRNGFAQEQEFEADITAIGLLDKAGYDPSALGEVLQILETTQPSRPGGFNATHPAPAARLDNLAASPFTGNGRSTRVYRESRFSSFIEAAHN
jgi:predicted Zn-dependent protease